MVGTGQSGGQIAEELHAAGREVHLAVSIVPEAPRRYRGQDLIYWMLETGKHGPEYGVNALTTKALPSPAARFAPNPLLSGTDGGHAIHLRELGRRGMHLHGHLETIDDGDITFSDDLPDRLAAVESVFAQRSGKAIDAYIAAAGIDAPEHQIPPSDGWLPSEQMELNVAAANITSVIWASGYKLDFRFVEMPLVDEWGYPEHTRGVTEIPGLYVVGLPWLTRHYSAIVGGVGLDARYIAEQISGP